MNTKTRIALPLLLAFGACGDVAASVDAASPDAALPDARPDATQPDAAPSDAGPPQGGFTHFVNDTLTVPQNSQQTRDLAFNVDGDANERPDNAMGGIFAAFSGQGINFQTIVTDALTRGSLVQLHSLQATSFTDATNVGWTVLIGVPVATPPVFDGTDVFTVNPNGPTDGTLVGDIVAGEFTGGPGNVTVQLSFGPGEPVRIELIGARIKATVTASTCSQGVLGGAITKDELDLSVIPGIRQMLNNLVQDDAPDGQNLAVCATVGDACPNTPDGEATACNVERQVCVSSGSKTILNLFDVNHDAVVQLAEIKDNTLMMALLAPDVDLLDATGAFNPLQDGVKDSLSIGFGFTCVNATFNAPNE